MYLNIFKSWEQYEKENIYMCKEIKCRHLLWLEVLLNDMLKNIYLTTTKRFSLVFFPLSKPFYIYLEFCISSMFRKK